MVTVMQNEINFYTGEYQDVIRKEIYNHNVLILKEIFNSYKYDIVIEKVDDEVHPCAKLIKDSIKTIGHPSDPVRSIEHRRCSIERMVES
jgi:hypothetical protein